MTIKSFIVEFENGHEENIACEEIEAYDTANSLETKLQEVYGEDFRWSTIREVK